MPDDPQSREQAALLPGKRAEDAGWAVTVPDEAVEAARAYIEVSRDTEAGWFLDRALAAAAPAIVAANQPEPAHETTCPACGATIRARTADQADGGLLLAITKALGEDAGLSLDRGQYVRQWPGDEQEYHRRPGWPSFTDREHAMQVYRRDKLAARLVAAVEAFVAAQIAAARADLLAVATGRIKHIYQGACPDWLEGPDSRDENCPACRVLGVLSGHDA